MDCFNYSCPFRQNITSTPNSCECTACQRRCGAVTYVASNRTLTADEIARGTIDPNHGVGAGC